MKNKIHFLICFIFYQHKLSWLWRPVPDALPDAAAITTESIESFRLADLFQSKNVPRSKRNHPKIDWTSSYITWNWLSKVEVVFRSIEIWQKSYAAILAQVLAPPGMGVKANFWAT